MPSTVRISDSVKEKIDKISKRTGWTQEEIFDWFLKNIDVDGIDFFIEGPTIVISRVPVKKGNGK